jgi:hypothetical protein
VGRIRRKLSARTRHFLIDPRDERGATVAIVAICMVALLGVAMLAVDGGRLYVERRREVLAADSAALAAALEFARNTAQCGTNEGPAMLQADMVAAQNVALPSKATRVQFVTNCAEATVTVTYKSHVDTPFAPVLGFANGRDVSATAVAKWGVAGGGHGTPLMLRQKFVDDCVKATPLVCGAWLNDRPDKLGDAAWAFLNLRLQGMPQWGWNVPKTYSCPNVGTSDTDLTARVEWIQNGTSWLLPINDDPTPTYVCSTSGHSASSFQVLTQQIGDVMQFPVNCPSPLEAPACASPTRGQIDKYGNPCPPPCSQPDKYDIVSLVPFLLVNVLKGDDPAAYGNPGTSLSGHCIATNKFTRKGAGTSLNVDTLPAPSCPGGKTSTTLVPGNPFVYNTTPSSPYTNCAVTPAPCDYAFDPATHVIKWTDFTKIPKKGLTVTVEFDWTVAGTTPVPGACGYQESDPNAICLVVEWTGPVAGGGLVTNPAYDFGLRGVELIGPQTYS